MRRLAVGLGVAVAVGTVRCEGTNTGNPPGPLVSFTGSDCRLGQGQAPPASSAALGAGSLGTASIGTSRQSLAVDGGADGELDSDPNDFLWMNCVAWNLREDATLEVNFWNVSGGCGATWVGGSARFDGNQLLLRAFKRGCEIAQCGLCIYDFHFAVRDAPDGDIPVNLGYTDEHGKTCSDSAYGTVFTLPTSTERSGTRCDPIYGVGFAFPWCVRHGACRDMLPGSGGSDVMSCPTCPNGDVCAPIVEGSGTACLKPCTTDADCENPAMGCRNGGCAIVSRLSTP